MNQITVAGRVTAAPEMSTTETGTLCARFRVADNYMGPDGEETIYWQVKCYGKRAEFVDQYVRKAAGMTIVAQVMMREDVKGKPWFWLRPDRWELHDWPEKTVTANDIPF